MSVIKGFFRSTFTTAVFFIVVFFINPEIIVDNLVTASLIFGAIWLFLFVAPILTGMATKHHFQSVLRKFELAGADYIAQHGHNGVAIDRDSKKLLCVDVSGAGKLFNFDQIRAVNTLSNTDYSTIGTINPKLVQQNHYMLNIETNDFDNPTVIIGFGGNRHLQEEAFGKLRVALDFT